jgi:hypothetical protein
MLPEFAQFGYDQRDSHRTGRLSSKYPSTQTDTNKTGLNGGRDLRVIKP